MEEISKRRNPPTRLSNDSSLSARRGGGIAQRDCGREDSRPPLRISASRGVVRMPGRHDPGRDCGRPLAEPGPRRARAEATQVDGQGARADGPRGECPLPSEGVRADAGGPRGFAADAGARARPDDRVVRTGRPAERRRLEGWLASDSRAVAVVIGVAGIGKSALLARAVAEERRPKLLRRVYAHDDAHGLLSSLADFLARQNRRRLKAAITRPAYDPTEVIAVLREDLSGCVLAIDDLHACPAADTLLRAVVEHPPDAKILVATRTQPTFFEPPDVARGRVLELRLDGLDDASAAELLASRGASLDPGDVPRVIAATGGHPLALELFAASGLDAGAVETEQYVLDTVLEGLDDASEDLLRTFAVLRRPARSPETFGATLSQLRRLVRRALLHHRDEGYLLHDLVKEFFLRRMGDLPRRDAHGQI